MKFIRAFPTNKKVWVEDWQYDRVRWIHWSDSGKQIKACINGRTTSMARYLKGIKDPNYVVDHIDGDHRNNLDSNLRVSTHAENMQNRKPWAYKNKGSKFLGTSWHKREEKWQAGIVVSGVQKHLGYFDTEVDAAKAYDIAAIFYHKEFAKLNCPCPLSSATLSSIA